MEANETPDLILAKALSARLGNIPGLAVQTRPNQALQRTTARVFPYRSSFSAMEPEDPFMAGIEGQQGFLQVESMQFEIGVIAADLSYRGLVAIAQNEIIKAITGFQPYLGVIASTHNGITPFYPVGAVRAQAIRTQAQPIYERVIMVECQMKRYNGLPPHFVPNRNASLTYEKCCDIFGYMPWELIGNG